MLEIAETEAIGLLIETRHSGRTIVSSSVRDVVGVGRVARVGARVRWPYRWL